MTDSEMPMAEQKTTPTTRSLSRTGTARMWRRPAEASSRNPTSVCGARTSSGWIRRRQPTDTTKDRAVEQGQRVAAERREEGGAGERADEAQRLARRGQRRVGRRQQRVVDDRRQQRGSRRGTHDKGRAVEERDHVEDPEVLPLVDQQEQEDDEDRERVGDEQDGAAWEPVDRHAEQRREEPRDDQREEHRAGRWSCCPSAAWSTWRGPAAGRCHRTSTRPDR